MSSIVYTTVDGVVINFNIHRSARKNIIVRAGKADNLIVNVPPMLGIEAVEQWLCNNEKAVVQLWGQCKKLQSCTDNAPKQIWFYGQRYPCITVKKISAIHWHPQSGFSLPELSIKQQRALIATWLKRQAQSELLPRLQRWAQKINLHPKAISLSQARTFWGVCRWHSGIRLNWRLIGAPDFVIDYVCIHELCHLVHLNHSKSFWALVAKYTPNTQAAKAWLKQHGADLFLWDY